VQNVLAGFLDPDHRIARPVNNQRPLVGGLASPARIERGAVKHHAVLLVVDGDDLRCKSLEVAVGLVQ